MAYTSIGILCVFINNFIYYYFYMVILLKIISKNTYVHRINYNLYHKHYINRFKNVHTIFYMCL
jgi:hypothetical protein